MLIWLRSIQTYDIAASCRCRRPLCLCNRSRLEMNRTHSGSTQSFPKLRVWGSLLPPPPPGLMENRAASASVDMCCAVRTRDDRQPIYSTAIFPPQIWGGENWGRELGGPVSSSLAGGDGPIVVGYDCILELRRRDVIAIRDVTDDQMRFAGTHLCTQRIFNSPATVAGN